MPAAPPLTNTVTLLDAVEPLLQYICRLNRAARRTVGAGTQAKPAGGVSDTMFFAKPAGGAAPPAGGGKLADTLFFSKPATGTAPSFASGRSLSMDFQAVRAEVKGLLEDMGQKAAADFRLAAQLKKMEMPLLFFIDSMLSESKIAFAQDWNKHRLAYEKNELAGDEKFFDIVDETLKDPSEDAAERLAVLYLCIGLGFTGIYFRQPEFLRKTMLAIAPRIRHLLDSEQVARICPETYDHTDTRNLVQPPSNRLVVVAILFLCLTVAVVASYIYLYHDASKGLNVALDKVLVQDPAK